MSEPFPLPREQRTDQLRAECGERLEAEQKSVVGVEYWGGGKDKGPPR